MNLVNSNSFLDNLTIANVPSDGVDIDFGTLEFSKIVLHTKNKEY